MKIQERYSKQIDIPGSPEDTLTFILKKLPELGYINCQHDKEKLTLSAERYSQNIYMRFSSINDAKTHVLIEGTSEESINILLSTFRSSLKNNLIKQNLTVKGSIESWLSASYSALIKNGFLNVEKDDIFFSVSGTNNNSILSIRFNEKSSEKIEIVIESDNESMISLFKKIVPPELNLQKKSNNEEELNSSISSPVVNTSNNINNQSTQSPPQNIHKNSNKKNGCLGCLSLIVIVIFISLIASMCSNSKSNNSSSPNPSPTSSTVTAKPTTTPLPTISPEELKSAATALSYDEMARYPDNHIGTSVVVSGEVIQVVEATGETDFRVKMNDDYDQIVLVAYTGTFDSGKILEGDTVSFYGKYVGTTTYTSTIGGSITVPALLSTVYE